MYIYCIHVEWFEHIMMSYAAEQRANTVKLHICLVITRYASDIAFRFFFQKAPFHRRVSFYDKSNIKRIENNIARKTFYMLPNTYIHIHLYNTYLCTRASYEICNVNLCAHIPSRKINYMVGTVYIHICILYIKRIV